jgi:hypothetical protein
MSALVTGSRRASLAERGDDLYETPRVVTEALLKVERLDHRIWEPAAGKGAIVDVLRGAGHDVVATDLVDYGIPGQQSGRDFLLERRAPDGIECIVTNPPYKLADEFVVRALDLCPRAIMLLRLAFLESIRRTPILDSGHLARVHLFKRRCPMMHRDGWTGPKVTSAMAFAWFVWDRDHSGPTTLNRITREIDGKTYHGAYTVFGTGMITVVGYGDLAGRTKTTQLGGSPAEGLARVMLREMVEDKAGA